MKTTIVNATVNPKTNTCYVSYSTGTEKMYPADKLPKTVQAWLAEHEELAVEEVVEETQTVVEEVVEERKYFLASYEHNNGVWCTNLVHAVTEADAWYHYIDKSGDACYCDVRPATLAEVEEAKAKGMPIVEAEHADHPDYVGSDDQDDDQDDDQQAEPTATELAQDLPSSLPKEPVKVDISMVLPRRTETLQKQPLAVPAQKITTEDTDPARTADVKAYALEGLKFAGRLAFKALAFVAEAALWSSVLLIQSIGKSLIAWLAIALPEVGRMIADLALWAWAVARRDLPVWARDTAKPALVRAYRATVTGAVRAYREGAVALEIIGLYARILISKETMEIYDATLWTANEQRVWA